MSAPRVRRLAARIDVQASALAAVLALVWLRAGPRTPDLAAQSYRVGLFSRNGFLVWDNGWFAGHHVPGYSLLFPPLGSLIGMRVLGACAAVAAAWCFARLAEYHFGPSARAGILWLAVACVLDVAIGRLTYDLGVAFGLAALLAAQRRRVAIAAALALLCAAASPLAGLFLGLVAVVLLVTTAARRVAVALGAPPLILAGALALLFPEGGREPFGGRAFWAALVLALVFTAAVPARERALRLGGLLYAAAVLASYLAHTPVGGNTTRLGAVFMGPLLVCAAGRRLPRRAIAPALVALLGWQLWGPVTEVAKSVGDPLARGSTYAGLFTFLEAHGRPLGRVEIPFTRSHWETAFVAARFPLARGWEKQLDTRYDGLFYRGDLGAASYHAWLRSEGVRYVALPAVRFDRSSFAEVALLRRGLPFLREVWAGGIWRVFALRDPLTLASGPATLTSLGPQSFALRFARGGSALVRVRYSPYWRAQPGCVAPGPGGFVTVSTRAPGRVEVGISFTPGRVLARGRRC